MSKVHVIFKKRFTKGNLKGLTITEHLPFVDNETAGSWIDGCQNNISRGKLDWEFARNGTRGESAITVCEGAWNEQFLIDFETFCKWESAIE